MDTWQRRALELFPDLQRDIESPEFTIYQLFFELVPRCRQAHSSGDTRELERIYGFADWCATQNSKDLWNAAGVAFYEHLADSDLTLKDLAHWVRRPVFEDIAGLLEARVGVKRVAELRSKYL